MVTQVKMYRIKYRESIMDSFKTLLGADSPDYTEIDGIARGYAEEHPDYLVRIVSNTEGFEIGYKFKSADNRLYYSFGTGWIPYG